MKKIIIVLFISLCKISISQEIANKLFQWHDSTLVGSWAYDNIYNECWGFEVNNREFADRLPFR